MWITRSEVPSQRGTQSIQKSGGISQRSETRTGLEGSMQPAKPQAGAWRIGQTVNRHLSVLMMLSWNGAACCRLTELSSAIQKILLDIIFSLSALLKPRQISWVKVTIRRSSFQASELYSMPLKESHLLQLSITVMLPKLGPGNDLHCMLVFLVALAVNIYSLNTAFLFLMNASLSLAQS